MVRRCFECCVLLVWTMAWGVPAAIAAPGTFTPEWVVIRTSPTTAITYPKDNWLDVARITGPGGASPRVELLQGPRWITLNRDDIGMLGLTADRMSSAGRVLDGASVQVLAHYVPHPSGRGQLRIHLVRTERRPDGRVYVSTGDFTPHHGERHRAYRLYLTAAERAAGASGHNPFAFARGDPTDPVFYNMSASDALVAIGHALRLTRAPAAWLASAVEHVTRQTESSGNVFRRRVTTTLTGSAQLEWALVGPAVLTGGGTSAWLCANRAPTALTPTACAAAEHYVHAGVAKAAWTGGNLPQAAEIVHTWRDERSSWTVVSYALASNAVGIDAGAYAITSTLGGSGGPITQAQDGFAGTTGDGPLGATASDPDLAHLARGIRDRHVTPTLDQGLIATRSLYRGTCDLAATGAECRRTGADPGIVSRADEYASADALATKHEYEACVRAGYSGAPLAMCAAPRREGVTAVGR